MIHHLVKIFIAEAAHQNPHGSRATQRLHGHSYKIEVLASGEPDSAEGWVVEFAQMKAFFEPIYRRVDHSFLNELPGLETDSTLPALQRWLLAQCEPRPAWLDGIRVSITGDLSLKIVRLREDEFQHLPERFKFTFEAAQSLPHLPSSHACSRIHGHSYVLEVAAKDMERLEGCIPQLYDLLDHHYLNEIPGLEVPTVEHLARWTWDWITETCGPPMVVVVQETPTARCIYYGEPSGTGTTK